MEDLVLGGELGDLVLEELLTRGSKGHKVKLVQEWLCFHGHPVRISGHFRRSTEAAVREFQQSRGLNAVGEVDEATFQALVEPMRNALQPIPPTASLGATVVAYARQHYQAGAREIGGENRGPWVRLYMGGRDGRSRRWCAGFVSFILAAAARTHGCDMPITPSISCDELAESAKDKRRFCDQADIAASDLSPGFLFLKRSSAGDWYHVGIVEVAGPEFFISIEGNAPDGKDDAVTSKKRRYSDTDFIFI